MNRRPVITTAVHPDDLKTTQYHCPLPVPADDMTAVMPANYAARLLGSTDPQADVITVPAPSFQIPLATALAACSKQAVDDYLAFLQLQIAHNSVWAKRVLLADYHRHPRLLARVLVALHARARHAYVFAETIIHAECQRTAVRADCIDELERMPGDDAKIVRLQICRT